MQATEEAPQGFYVALVFRNNETIRMMPKKALNNMQYLYGEYFNEKASYMHSMRL